MINLNDPLIGLPPGLNPAITQTKNYFAALENFQRTFAFKQGDSVLLLTDPLLDVRVTDVIIGLAKARGATVRQFMETSSQITAVPEATRALVAEADFVVSTWFCSILDPFFIAQRALVQRWVKITYPRDLDLLYSPQARFPAELVGEIIRATAARLPAGKDFSIQFADARGTDFSINSRLTCVRLCWVATAGAARCLLTSPAATYTTAHPRPQPVGSHGTP